MASDHPYYRKRLPTPQIEHDFAGDGLVDFHGARLDEEIANRVSRARALFDHRAAAAIRAGAGIDGLGGAGPPRIWPTIVRTLVAAPIPGQPFHFDRVPVPEPRFEGLEHLYEARDLLELKWYGDLAPTIHIPRSKCLALLAYLDFFPENRRVGLGLRSMVSRAVLAASPGWCGTFGPGVDDVFSLEKSEGNYDMTEMFLLPMVYRHYDDLSPAARELLITHLLAKGRIHRPRKDDTFTSSGNPNDWRRAGFVSPAWNSIDIGETENHILMIVTARYLTNQLLHQRNPATEYDNRRNDTDDSLSCFDLLLYLLRNMLRGDFSEYNAKSYQSETRWALLNLCTYAYDHEVRLGARMVLDYISTHIAVSTNDLRRLVPFRRRLTGDNAAHDANGFMTLGLLADRGGDPMAGYFAVQAGNIRIYEQGDPSSPVPFGITDTDVVLEALSDYRMPHLVQDLFVNDASRRFFQRLHRRQRTDEVEGSRNCDNMEIYASSPSYLVTAGGAPATWAIDPGPAALIDGDAVSQQLGAAVTTSFIPTGFDFKDAGNLIQFGSFSIKRKYIRQWRFLLKKMFETNDVQLDKVANYGVAPDFACGHQVYLPPWINVMNTEGPRDGVAQNPRAFPGFNFVNLKREKGDSAYAPGFFLAIYQETTGGFALMEAFDTWLDQKKTFEQFKREVLQRNSGLRLASNVVTQYRKVEDTEISFVIWSKGERNDAVSGAEVIDVRYSHAHDVDSLGRAERITNRLVNGTIMNSPVDALVEVSNPALGAILTLDFTDPKQPRRFDSQTGELEVAGVHSEIWVDFEYSGPSEGDVCRPFNTLSGAAAAVVDGGVIRIVPGNTGERGTIGGEKRFTLAAPIGGVIIGTASARNVAASEGAGEVSDREVWVQLDWPEINKYDVPYLFTDLDAALQAVADGGVVNIQPGSTPERLTIGDNGKRYTLVAPIGGVTIGA